MPPHPIIANRIPDSRNAAMSVLLLASFGERNGSRRAPGRGHGEQDALTSSTGARVAGGKQPDVTRLYQYARPTGLATAENRRISAPCRASTTHTASRSGGGT